MGRLEVKILKGRYIYQSGPGATYGGHDPLTDAPKLLWQRNSQCNKNRNKNI